MKTLGRTGTARRSGRTRRFAAALGLLALLPAGRGAAEDPFLVTKEVGGHALLTAGDALLSGAATVDSAGLFGTGAGRCRGHVLAGGDVRLEGRCRVEGDALCGPGREVRLEPAASVAGRTGPLGASPFLPAVDLAALEAKLTAGNDNARIPRTFLGRAALSGEAGRTLAVGDGDRLDLPEGTYLLDGLRLDGSAVVATKGRVRVLITGPVRLSGGSRLNPEAGPHFLRLVSSGNELVVEGNASLRAFVVAPRAAAVLRDDASLLGALSAASARLEGRARATRLVEDGEPLGAVFTASGAPLTDGALFTGAVRPEATAVPRVPLPRMELTLGGAPFRSGELVAVPGTHTLLARLSDARGRDAEASVTFRIVASGWEAPRLVIVSPPAGVLLAVGRVDVTGRCGTAATVDVNGVAATVSDGSFVARSVPLAEGENVLLATGIDPTGRSGSARTTVVRDTIPPAVAVLDGGLPLADGRLFRRPVVPVVSVVDAHPGTAAVTLDGTAFVPGTAVSAEGPHELSVAAEDRAGNRAATRVRFTVDTTPPSLAITRPVPGSIVGALPADLAGTCGDAVRVVSGRREGRCVDGTFLFPAHPFAEGRRTVVVVAVDAAGNESRAEAEYLVDVEPPALAIISPSDGAVLGPGPIHVRGTATDATLREVAVDGLPATVAADGSFVAGPFARPDGATTFTAVAKDAAGRASQAAVRVTIDTVPPAVSIRIASSGAPLSAGAVLAAPPVLEVAVSDATTPERTTKVVRVDGAPYAGSAVAGEGAHRVDVLATDGAGNVTAESVSFVVDTRPPVFTDLLPGDGTVGRSATVTISGRVSADATEVQVLGRAANLSGGAFSLPGVSLVEGTNAVELRAVDGAGNVGRASLRLVLDTTPPAIALAEPSPGALVGSRQARVSGSATDPNLESVTVEGGAAVLDGSSFRRDGVPLVEGTNTLTATARDRAGNVASTTVAVTADTTAPTVAIGAPATGAVLGASPVVVTGSAEDVHLASVAVNGVPARLAADGRFRAEVPLPDGRATLTATARDALGHEASASVGVTVDGAAPVVTIVSPEDGVRFRTTPQRVVVRLGSPENVESVSVNGRPAAPGGGDWVVDLPLVEGTNPVTARARKTTGKEGTAGVTVTLDTIAPQLVSSVPADGESGVSLSPEVRLVFSERLDRATVTPATVVLRPDGGEPLAAAVSVARDRVSVAPSAPLADGRLHEILLSSGLADLAGNPLAPTTVRFTTRDETAPAAPSLDPVRSPLCAATLDLSGSAEPGATIVVTGGAVAVRATVPSDGRFRVAVPLRAETHQTLTVVARDAAENTSPAASLSLTTDCTPPSVRDVARTAAGLTVTFDEAIDPDTLRSGDTVRLDATAGGGGTIAASLVLSGDGLVLAVTSSSTNLEAVGFTLALSSGVADRAGNALVPFVRTFAPIAKAAVLVGELFDDATSRPLGAGAATLLVSGGVPTPEPRPRASVTSTGLFALPATGGDALVRLSSPGYLDVWRRATLVETADRAASETLFDARLTPVSPVATPTEKDGGRLYAAPRGARPNAAEAHADPARLSLFAPAGALPSDAVVTLTERSAQGLPVLLPLGWTVAGAVHVRIADASGAPLLLASPLVLKLPDRYGASATSMLTLARLDSDGLVWIARGSATASAGLLEATVRDGGDWVVLVADPPPTAPPAATPGAALEGAPLPAVDPLESATVVAAPADVLAAQTATVSLSVSSPAPVPSGFALQCLVTEELTLLDGSTAAAPSFLSDLVLQRRADGTTGLSIPVRASELARRAALSVGWERFAVRRFPFEVRQGSVVSGEGGAVEGPSGWSLVLPSGAVSAPVSVALTPLGASDLPTAPPAGFTLVGAVRVGAGGATFSLPASLSLRLAAPPPTGQDLLLVALEEREGRLVFRAVARAAWDETASTVATRPIDPTRVPWPGVRGEGTYLFLASTEPLAWAAGRLLGLDGAALPGLDVRVAAWPLAAVTDGDGGFALALRARPETIGAVEPRAGDLASLVVVPEAPGQEIAGLELRVVATPPWVEAVAPLAGATVPVGTRFVVELSEPLDPLSVTPSATSLAAVDAGGAVALLAVRVETSGRSFAVTPLEPLPGNTELLLRLSSGLRDLAGRGLVDRVTRRPADFVASFTTEDLTPPDGKPWLVTIGLPTGEPEPTVEIVGAPGAVCPNCHVVAWNDTTQATAATDALSDGSFRLVLPARAGDAVRIEIEKANGMRQTLPPLPLTGDGGRTAIVGPAGGTWQTPDGYRLTVPRGAFAGPATVSTSALPRAALDALVAPPRDVAWIGSFALDLAAAGGPVGARAGFDLSFPAPPPGGATGQLLLAQVVEVFGERRLMVVDLLSRAGDRLVTDRSGEVLKALARQGLAAFVGGRSAAALTLAPASLATPLAASGDGNDGRPASVFDGVCRRGTYALYEATTPMAVVAGVFSGATLVATSSESDFVFAGSEVLTPSVYRLVTPAGRPFSLALRDVDSGLGLFEGEVTPGSDPGRVTPVDPPINRDDESPAVLSARPATVHRFLALPVPGASISFETEVAPGIRAVTTFSGAALRVDVTGAAAAVGAGARVRLLNVSAEEAEPGAGVAPESLAAPDGSFPALSVEARPGDRLSLAVDAVDVPVGAPLVLVFDELVRSLSDAAWRDAVTLAPDEPGAAPIPLRFQPEEEDGATRRVVVVPGTAFERGRRYLLRVEGLVDTGSPPKAMAAPFVVGFGSPAARPVTTETTGFVRKVLAVGGLLFETGESNEILVRDVSRPSPGGLGAPCGTVPLPGPGRDLALDLFGRLVCVGGGTDGYGFLKVFDVVPATGCTGRLREAGAVAVASRLGGDDNASIRGGVPRRVSFHQPVETKRWVAGRGEPPWGLQAKLPIGLRQPYALAGPAPAGPDPLRPRMAKLTNVTTGVSAVQRVAPGTPVALSLPSVSRGDLLALELGTISVAAVDVLGYGLAVVDLEAVYAPGDASAPSPFDPSHSRELLLAWDGTSSGGGLPCQPARCDTFQRCAASGPTCELFAAPPAGWEGLGLTPIRSLDALADAVVLPETEPDEELRVVGALNGFGLVDLSVDLLARERSGGSGTVRAGHVAGLLGHLPLRKSDGTSARAVGIAVAPGMMRPAGASACSLSWPSSPSGEPLPRDLAFVAAGRNGVWVVDVSEAGAPRLTGRLQTPGDALTVSVDARRALLYVGEGGEGVSVWDVSDPCGETAPGLEKDPRFVTAFRFGSGGGDAGVANAPVEVDPQTGFAWAGANQVTGTAGLLEAFTLAPPPLHAVADTDGDGKLELVTSVVPLGVENPSKSAAFDDAGILDPHSDPSTWPRREDGTSHDPYVPDHFRLLAFLPGGAGETVEAEVASTGPEGADLRPSAPGFPPSAFTAARGGALTLRRQSDDPAQPAYNRYLSDPVVVLVDPRAQLAYERTPEETSRPGFPGEGNPFACRNCDPAADVADALLSTEAVGSAPARRTELWSGDRVRLAFSPSLKARLPHLERVDLRTSEVVLESVRGDLAPAVAQRPVLSESSVLGVSTHSLELVVEAVDAVVPGRQLSFAADRTYFSQALHDGPLGRGWDSSLFERLRPLPSGDVDYFDGYGRRLTFEAWDDGFLSPEGVVSSLALGKDGRYYLVEPDGAVTVFDEHGRLLVFQDRRAKSLVSDGGNRHLFLYDAAGRLATVLDDLGRPFSLGWDASTGRLSSIRDGDGRQVEYAYDAGGSLLERVSGFDPASARSRRPRTAYVWSAAGASLRDSLFQAAQLVSQADGNGETPWEITWKADSPGSAASVRLAADGGTTSFRLVPEERLTQVTDPAGYVTELEHDGRGHPVAVVDPARNRSERTYVGRPDPRGGERQDGLLAIVTPPLGNATVLDYDLSAASPASRFNLRSVTRHPVAERADPPLVTRISGYDAHNLPEKVVAEDGQVTEVRRDGKGDPELVLLPGTDPVEVRADAFGRVTRVAGPARTVALGYDDEPGKTGGLRTLNVRGGESATLERDSRGNVTSVTDGTLRTTRFSWNALDQLESEESGAGPAGAQSAFEYDATGLPVRATVRVAAPDDAPPVLSESTFDFDSLGRLASVTSSDEGTVRVRRDSRGNLAEVQDAGGGRVAFGYESRGLLETVTDSAGGITTFARNANGTPESVRDPAGRLTRFLLDGHERVVGVDDGAGAFTVVTRDAAGRVTSSKVFDKDEQGNSRNLFSWTELVYDAGGRPVRRIRKLFDTPSPEPETADVVTEWKRDGAGRVVEAVDPLGRATRTGYDAAGRVGKVTDAAGNVLEVEYDAAGRRTKETRRDRAPDGSVVSLEATFEHDDQGRLVKQTAPGGRVTEYTRDGRGLVTSEKDPDGFVTRFEYDLAGRRVKRTDPLGAVTRWEYDLRGNLTKVVDANGNVTTWAWNPRGLPLAETRGEPVSADGRPTWTFAWDARGLRTASKDPNGTEQTFAYDLAGRLTGRSVRKGTGVLGLESASFTLDVLGRPVAETTLDGTTRVQLTRRFDSLGRALEEVLRVGSGPERRIRRTFDAADNPVSVAYPSGREIAREYDPLDRVAAVRSAADGLLARYQDVGLRPLRRVLGNGLTEGRAYDAAGTLALLEVGSVATPGGSFSAAYARNGRSLKTTVVRADLGRRHRYDYDAAGRIVREQLGLPGTPSTPETPEVDRRLTLDALLNVVLEERTESGVTVATSGATGPRNQVAQWGGDAARYDPNGNLVSFRERSYRYDADNRLVGASFPGGELSILRDASGRKVRETLSSSGVTHAVDLVHDGDRILESFAADEGTPLSSLVYGRGIDEVVRADLDPDGDGTATSVVPVQDELGNVVSLTGPDGALLERYEYEGAGRFRVFAPDGTPRTTPSFGWTRLFQGREYLAPLDAYDFRNRLLLPSLGRFAQEDPLGYVDSLNLYQAFGGSWVNATDPWGLTSFREWVNEFADDAFSGGSALKKGAAAGLFLLDAAFSVASAGATDKIHGAQEALDRGQISDAEYWKRTGVAVGQTVASYAGGAAAGAAGARAGVRLLGSTGVTAGGVRAVGALSGASAGVGSQLAADVVGNVAGTQEGLSSGRNYALSALIGGASGAASALPGRTVRDLAIDETAPRALSTRRPIGKDPYQNRLAQRDIAAAELEGATNVRVNQQQVTASGERVGVNRPDVQYTDAAGRRIYVEYDIAPAERAVPHALRLLANDPAGKVYLMTTPPVR